MDNSYLEIINKRKQIEIVNIKICNEITSKYGLVLSDNQISNMLERRKETLKENGRIELRFGIIDKLILNGNPLLIVSTLIQSILGLQDLCDVPLISKSLPIILKLPINVLNKNLYVFSSYILSQ